MDKLELLLDMTEHPERYTEQQIHDLLNDEDVRKHYDVMVRLRNAFVTEKAHSPLSQEGESLDVRNQRTADSLHHRRGTRRASWVFRIAAIFIAAAFLGGLIFAAYHALSHRQTPTAQVSAPSLTERAGGESVRFADIRLDSILTVVSAHYEQQVKFLDEAPRELRFTITWNSEDSLATFIMTLNEFDGLHLCNKQDTIFVESVEAKEEEE